MQKKEKALFAWCENLWEVIDKHFSGAQGDEDWDEEFEVTLPIGVSTKEFDAVFTKACIYEEDTAEFDFEILDPTDKGEVKIKLFISLVEPQK